MMIWERDPLQQLFRVWRLYRMYKATMGFVKGLGTGILATAALTAVGSQMMRKDKRLRKSVNRAVQAVGSAAGAMAGSVEHMFRG